MPVGDPMVKVARQLGRLGSQAGFRLLSVPPARPTAPRLHRTVPHENVIRWKTNEADMSGLCTLWFPYCPV